VSKLNHRTLRKKDGTRVSAWEVLDKPALKPLPMEPFDLSDWSRARVNIDYHRFLLTKPNTSCTIKVPVALRYGIA
jgi:hypothetical protein